MYIRLHDSRGTDFGRSIVEYGWDRKRDFFWDLYIILNRIE